jgi:peptidyl-tRNA hydrolase
MKEIKDELIQYYVVNNDLIKEYDMSPGKIAAQVAHVATIIAIDNMNNIDRTKFYNWMEEGQKKIVLRGNQKDLEKLVNMGFNHVRDLGLTEIPANSLTVVGLGVMLRSEAQQYVKRLQLL